MFLLCLSATRYCLTAVGHHPTANGYRVTAVGYYPSALSTWAARPAVPHSGAGWMTLVFLETRWPMGLQSIHRRPALCSLTTDSPPPFTHSPLVAVKGATSMH